MERSVIKGALLSAQPEGGSLRAAHRSKNRDGWGNHSMEESRRGPASRGRIIEEVLHSDCWSSFCRSSGMEHAVDRLFLASLLGPSLAVKSWLPLHLLGRKAARKFEAADPCLPACCAGSLACGGIVLIHVPERAVISGVDIHRGVVAPAGIGGRLYARAVDDDALAQGHLAQGIAVEPARVADAWIHIHSVDHAVAQRHVALPIHCDASHPAMHAVAGCIGALLIDRVSI